MRNCVLIKKIKTKKTLIITKKTPKNSRNYYCNVKLRIMTAKYTYFYILF